MVTIGNLIHRILFRNSCFTGIPPEPCLFEEPGRIKTKIGNREDVERCVREQV